MELADRARAALRRCGVDLPAATGPHRRWPAPRSRARTCSPSPPPTPRPSPHGDRRRARGVPHLAHGAGAGTRRAGQAVRRAASPSTRPTSPTSSASRSGRSGRRRSARSRRWSTSATTRSGLSRQLQGRTMPSERPGHRLMETWHPTRRRRRHLRVQLPGRGLVVEHRAGAGVRRLRGVEGVRADAADLATRAARCSPARRAECGAPANLNVLVVGDAEAAAPLLDDRRVPVVSATGSERMGAAVAPRVAARFGRLILELGGNNAAVVAPSADLDLAVRGIVFAAAGTAGQRCTTMRRVIVHESRAEELVVAARGRVRAACRSAIRSPRARWSVRSSPRPRSRACRTR